MADHVREPDRSPGRQGAEGGQQADGLAADAVDRINAALLASNAHRFLLTSAFDGNRSGMRVLSVQVCARDPLLLCIAARKGHVIEPLIRDSHSFGLCLIDVADRLTLKKFPIEDPGTPDDPFESLAVTTMRTGSPLLVRTAMAMDCEVVRHFDLEADHELYVGSVVDARFSTASPSGPGS